MVKNYYIIPSMELKTIQTDYGYDIMDKFIADIINNWSLWMDVLYVHMIISHPDLSYKQEVIEKLVWDWDTNSFNWDMDWCEGETLVTVLGLYSDDFINEIIKQFYHAHRGKKGGLKYYGFNKETEK